MNLVGFTQGNSHLLGQIYNSKQKAVSNLASGRRVDIAQTDAGGFSFSSRISSQNKMDQVSRANLQNMVSYTQSQSQTLSNSSKVLQRMSELASLASNGLMSDTDRENYNKEFISLTEQLSDLSKTKFGSKNVFGAGGGGIDFIKDADGLDYANKIGLTNDPDTGSILGSDVGGATDLNDDDVIPDGDASFSSVVSNESTLQAAYNGLTTAEASIFHDLTGIAGGIGWLKASEDAVSLGFGWSTTSDSFEIEIDTTSPEGGRVAYVSYQYSTSNFEGNVLKLVLEEKDFDPPYVSGDRIIAHEMVHALQAQNTYIGDPTGDGTSSANWLKEGLAEFIHGGDSRVRGHLGADPTDDEIQELIDTIGTGNEDWSSSDQYAAAYLATRFLHSEIKDAGYSDGIKHMTTWMKTQFDADKGSAASGFNAYINTFLSSRGYSNNDEFITAFKGGAGLQPVADATGQSLALENVSKVTLTNTDTYNLSTVESALETLSKISSLIENVSTEMAKTGANMSKIEKQIDKLQMMSLNQGAAYARVMDSDLADESMAMPKADLKLNFHISAITQAKGISQNVLGILFN